MPRPRYPVPLGQPDEDSDETWHCNFIIDHRELIGPDKRIASRIVEWGFGLRGYGVLVNPLTYIAQKEN